MTQEKMRKVITACVSAATVLLVLLFSYLIYQWVTIGVLNKRIAEAQDEVNYWQEIVNKGGSDLEYYESQEYLQQALIELQMLQEKNK